jgi:hypothetical protein
MTDDLVATTADLSDVRQRRHRLAAQMREVEAVLASPLTGRPDAWTSAVGSALGTLDDVLSAHIAATEAPDGLLATVRAESPALDPQIRRLEADHERLRAALADVRRDLASSGADVDRCGAVRDAATELVAAIARHRQRGADLLYQAYDVDLGGGG